MSEEQFTKLIKYLDDRFVTLQLAIARMQAKIDRIYDKLDALEALERATIDSMKQAPNFTLNDQNNQPHSLADYRGKWVVLYFYPKDDTPGCTTEACSFRDEGEVIAQQGAVVLGVSKDSVSSHKKFADKHNLTFTLLSDPEHAVIEMYGAWGKKKFMGHEFDGTLRQTFIINPEGQIVKEYPDVTPKGHALQIIEDLRALQGQTAGSAAQG